MTAARLTALAVLILSALLFAAAALGELAGDRARHDEPGDRARAALEADPRLRRQPIEVVSLDGELILRGSTADPELREAALDSVRRLPGIGRVRSEIRLTGEIEAVVPADEPTP